MISLYTYFFTNLGMPYARTEYWMLYRTQELKTTFKDPKHGFYKQEHEPWLTTPSIRLDRQTWKIPASWAFCLSTHAITCPRLNSGHGCHHGPGRPVLSISNCFGYGRTAVDRQAMKHQELSTNPVCFMMSNVFLPDPWTTHHTWPKYFMGQPARPKAPKDTSLTSNRFHVLMESRDRDPTGRFPRIGAHSPPHLVTRRFCFLMVSADFPWTHRVDLVFEDKKTLLSILYEFKHVPVQLADRTTNLPRGRLGIRRKFQDPCPSSALSKCYVSFRVC